MPVHSTYGTASMMGGRLTSLSGELLLYNLQSTFSLPYDWPLQAAMHAIFLERQGCPDLESFLHGRLSMYS